MLDWFTMCVKTVYVETSFINMLNKLLTNWKQRAVLKWLVTNSWVAIRTGVWQWSILWSFLLLIYVNNFSSGIKNKCKLFPDGSSLFSVAYDLDTSTSDINKDLKLIIDWFFHWKLSFNSKQAQEIKFRRKNLGMLLDDNHFKVTNVISNLYYLSYEDKRLFL